MPKISALPPASRAAGNNEIPMVNTDDATTEKATVDLLMPTGTVLDFAGAAAPAGFLLCYGQTLNAATSPQYQALYDVIGNVYGGTDHTNFKVPDLRGRVVAGQDDMGGSSANRLTDQADGVDGDVLGDTGGLETNTHNHWTGVSNDGGGRYMTNSSTITAAGGRSRVVTKSRSLVTAASSNTTTREDSTYNETINVVQPTIILNKIIKY